MADFGSFFGGVAQGWQSQEQLNISREELEAKRQQQKAQAKDVEHKKSMESLEIQGKFRAFSDAIVQEPDPNRKSLMTSAYQKAYEQVVGKKMPALLLNVLKADPATARSLLDATAKQGMTMEDLNALAENPLAALDALVSFSKVSQEEAGRRFAGGGTTTTPLAPSPNVQGTPLPASTAPIDPQVARATDIRNRIAEVRQNRAGVVQNTREPRALTAQVKGIDDELARLEDELREITTKQGVTIAAEKRQTTAEIAREGRQPVPEEALLQARRALTNRGFNETAANAIFPPAMKRLDFDEVSKRFGAVAPGGEGPSAVPSSAAPQVAPQATPQPAPSPRPGASSTFPEVRAVAQLEAETDAAKRRSLADAAIKSGYKSFDEIKEIGISARRTMGLLQPLAAAAQTAGTTGNFVTPLKDVIADVAGVFGATNLRGKQERELITGLGTRLAMEITTLQKGQQSDKELALALISVPGAKLTPQGLAVMVYVANEMAKKSHSYDLEAKRWMAERQAEGKEFDAPDRQGRSFQEVFDANMAFYAEKNGTIAERTSKAFKIDHKALLKGIVKASQ